MLAQLLLVAVHLERESLCVFCLSSYLSSIPSVVFSKFFVDKPRGDIAKSVVPSWGGLS